MSAFCKSDLSARWSRAAPSYSGTVKTSQAAKGSKTADVPVHAANFESEVLNWNQPVIVDFWSETRGLAPLLREVARECLDEAKVAQVNVDEERELGVQFNIGDTATLLYFAKGEVRDRTVGVLAKEAILSKVREMRRRWSSWRNFRAPQSQAPKSNRRPRSCVQLLPDSFGLLPWRLDFSKPPGCPVSQNATAAGCGAR
jgi:thioredoxin 1